MSIASRISAMQEHLQDDYDVLTLAGADLTNVNKNILNLKSTWQERLLYFMNNGTDVVWNNWDKVTGEGTTITLNNTEEAPMKIVLKGNTLQNGTPTPETPQDIHVVSGDNSIKVNGRNFFEPFPNGSITSLQEATTSIATIKQAFSYSRTITFNNGEITGYPAIGNGSYYIWKCSFKNLKPNTRYTLSCDLEFNNMTGASVSGNVWVFNNSFNVNNITTLSEHISAWNFITDVNGEYTPGQFINIDPRCYQETTTMRIYNIMLVEGANTSATMPTYEAYKGASYPINLGDIELCKIGDYQDKIDKSSGKNLFDNSKAQIGKAWNNASNTARAIVITKVQPNTTYTISYLNKSAVDDIYWFDRVNEDDSTYITGNTQITQTTTITTKSNANYIGIQFNKTSITQADIEKVGIMLNEGSTALPYEPYGTGWYLNKQIGKVVLDGSENWAFRTDWPLTNASVFRNSSYIAGEFETATEGFSNYLVVKPNISSESSYHHIRVTNANGYGTQLFIDDNFLGITSEDTAAQKTTKLKTWLGNNNTTFYGIKPTPTYTEITDSTLLSQLNALAKSYNSQTNISQESNDLPFIINATALKEMA